MTSARSAHGGAAPSEQDGAVPLADPEPTAGPASDATARPDLGAGAPTDPDPAPPAPPSRRLEVASALVSLVLLAGLAFLARRIELRTETGGIDPRWWPELLGTVGAVLAVALLVVALVRPSDRGDLEATTRTGYVRLGASVALTVGYLLLWPLVGFLVATPIYLLALILLFGGRGWRTLIGFPVLTTAFIYLLFHTLLEVPL
ncbi:tripartite tricarboxylate transporter TctB family protein [Cellulosimicrobium arenosum]|uniref:Tripartite tricarboxylate transporter TctB family protein n=1 Tax=Cellulosimicrobium arenosum TaxID=2708133 RepID=A0A927G8P6_9MICO|nr:tripartite tricarboxylate transporter TctB family protein [Cellulosimicrobium arenosum]MBD8078604.1 tripartite tricarboxylate transporter TctB family protein [Cellulosimicrobium arenosum]